MNHRPFLYILFAASVLFLTAAKPVHELKSVDETPKGLSKKITALLNSKGHKIVGPKGTVCEIWLLKNFDFKPGFKPTLTVKYPFKPGQLIGAMRVPKRPRFKDFRGQRVRSGVYTLRYGHQPEDGNHLGTNPIIDFLLALPAKYDSDPGLIKMKDKLHKKSAKTTRSPHPAIFSLLSTTATAEKKKTTSLTHDDEHDFWILELFANGKDNDKKLRVPIKLVTIGQAEE